MCVEVCVILNLNTGSCPFPGTQIYIQPHILSSLSLLPLLYSFLCCSTPHSLSVLMKVRESVIKHIAEFLSAETVCNIRAEKREKEREAARDLGRRATAAAKTMEQAGGVTAANFTEGLCVSINVVIDGVRGRVKGHINSRAATRSEDKMKRFDVRCFRSVGAKALAEEFRDVSRCLPYQCRPYHMIILTRLLNAPAAAAAAAARTNILLFSFSYMSWCIPQLYAAC